MQETKKKKRAVALFVIVLICLCGWWAVRKEGFFLDEIYSYGLSNSSYVPFLSWLHGGEQVANGKLPEAVFTQSEFLNYVAPQGSTRFDYASVYYNQTQDVHPPLFYFLLHTVCSLFPGSFTKWTGLGMNFVLLGGTLAALYALGMELFADWKKSIVRLCIVCRGAVAVRDGRTGGVDHGPEHGNCVERCPTGRL